MSKLHYCKNLFFMNNHEVLLDNHLTIYILLKDKISFEFALEENQIDHYCDLDQTDLEDGIRYCIRNEDRLMLNKILRKNKIIASTETIPMYDYRDVKKGYVIYLIIALVVALITYSFIQLF